MTRLAVADTIVWSNFAQSGRPRAVATVFPAVVAPTAVLRELETGTRLGYLTAADWSWIKVVQLTAEEREEATSLASIMDAGEAACLAVAHARGGDLLTDDRAARSEAESLGVPVTGTIGVLIRLVDAAELTFDDADQLLLEMIQRGYHSPVRSLSDL